MVITPMTLTTLLLAALMGWPAAQASAQIASAAPAPPADAAPEQVAWYSGNYNAAVSDARKQGKLLLLAFVPEWSDYSRKLVDETFLDGTVAKELNDLICLMYTEEDNVSRQIIKLYNVEQFPTIVVAEADGKIEDLITGFIPAQPLVGEMRRIKSGNDTVSARRALAEATPTDLNLRWSLADKLKNVNDERRARKVMQSIRAEDPEGRTLAGARVAAQDVWDAIESAAPGGPDTWDIAPMLAHIESLSIDLAAFDGWNAVARFHAGLSRMPEARAAFMRAWTRIPPDQVLNWGNDMGNFFLEAEDVLTDAEKAFAVEVAERAAVRAVALGDPEAENYGVAFNGTNYNAYLAERLDTVTRCLIEFDPTPAGLDKAQATAERCIELDPDNEEYPGRLEMIKARRQP
jgi:hypothetical protein